MTVLRFDLGTRDFEAQLTCDQFFHCLGFVLAYRAIERRVGPVREEMRQLVNQRQQLLFLA